MADIDKRLMQVLSGRMGRSSLRNAIGHHVDGALDESAGALIYVKLRMWDPLDTVLRSGLWHRLIDDQGRPHG